MDIIVNSDQGDTLEGIQLEVAIAYYGFQYPDLT